MKKYPGSNALNAITNKKVGDTALEGIPLVGWRDLLEFADNNRLPALPGVDATVMTDLFVLLNAPLKPVINRLRINAGLKNRLSRLRHAVHK